MIYILSFIFLTLMFILGIVSSKSDKKLDDDKKTLAEMISDKLNRKK